MIKAKVCFPLFTHRGKLFLKRPAKEPLQDANFLFEVKAIKKLSRSKMFPQPGRILFGGIVKNTGIKLVINF